MAEQNATATAKPASRKQVLRQADATLKQLARGFERLVQEVQGGHVGNLIREIHEDLSEFNKTWEALQAAESPAIRQMVPAAMTVAEIVYGCECLNEEIQGGRFGEMVGKTTAHAQALVKLWDDLLSSQERAPQAASDGGTAKGGGRRQREPQAETAGAAT